MFGLQRLVSRISDIARLLLCLSPTAAPAPAMALVTSQAPPSRALAAVRCTTIVLARGVVALWIIVGERSTCEVELTFLP
jgi:hypothetical protein